MRVKALELITNSRMSTFNACRRKHFYRYVQGYRPLLDKESAEFGSIMHKGLEAWWLACAEGRGLMAQFEAQAAIAKAAQTASFFDEATAAKAELLMDGYHYRYAPEMGQWEVIAVERQFEAPMPTPAGAKRVRGLRVAGKVDVLVRRRADGTVWIVEHKCVAGSTRIFDHASMQWTTVEALHSQRRGALVTGVDASGALAQAATEVPRPVGARDVYRVRTKAGRILRVSGNHPCLTLRGWVPAAELSGSDWLAVPRAMATNGGVEAFTDEEVRMVGYILGDGCASGENQSFSKTDEAVLKDVIRCAQAIGDHVEAAVYDYTAPVIRFPRRGAVRALLSRLGVTGLAAEKVVPLGLAITDRQVSQLIGALWSTDGCVDAYTERRPDGRECMKPRICYVSRSPQLCIDIQALLQRIGVVSSVRTSSVEYEGERLPVWTTAVITRASKRRFLELARSGEIPLLRYHVNPSDMLGLISDAPQGADNRGQPRLDAQIWWDAVESVVIDGQEMLYDITVPGLSTFVADGIVTHNTTTADLTPGSTYWQRLRMDTQVSVYFEGARSLGLDPVGCLYDVIAKPEQRPLKATPEDKRRFTKEGKLYAKQRLADETMDEFKARMRDMVAAAPEEYYQRREVVRLESELEESRRDTYETALMIRETKRAERAPRNADACMNYGSICAYYDVCSGAASIDDPTRFKRLDDVHPELANDNAGGGKAA